MRDLIIECMNWKVENTYMKSRMGRLYKDTKKSYWTVFLECDDLSDKDLMAFYERFHWLFFIQM